ncbi:MAG: cytochrome c peroxidase [Bacteroidota bacterium]
MKKKLIIFCLSGFVFAATLLMDGCKKLAYPNATHINFTIPPGFPPTVYNFQNNPLTEEGFLLGRKLFYDGRLSKDGIFSCASCHQQLAAFTTFEHDRSHGYNNSHTLRNAPGLFNLAWVPAFRQDGSATTIEQVALAHITSQVEMAETIPSIITKIKDDAAYTTMFGAAYGNEIITQEKILNAITQFVVSLVSANSKFDKVQRGETSFTPQEQNGYSIFQSKCATCHAGNLFTDYSYRNTGIEIDPSLNDFGRLSVTGNKNDSLKFRVPSLRNLEATSYYAHDGRLSVFRMMIQHYRNGVNPGATVDPLVANGISITNAEENDLVAFLRTLTDTAFINSPRFKE